MPLYDWACTVCGEIFEHMAKSDVEITSCHQCSGDARRVISVSTGFHRPDAPWLASVREVVDKESRDPATRRFLETPNRENHAAWMKSRGLRHYEEGEKPIQRRPDTPVHVITEKLMKERQRMNAIAVR